MADDTDKTKLLTEADVPGASLNGLTVPQLKRWLICRNTSIKEKKADLVARQVWH